MRRVVPTLVLLLTLAPQAPAHVTMISGPFRIKMGWLQEPAFTGSENSVQVAVSDLSGSPVGGADVALAVQVSFGDARITLPLLPVKQPGEFGAVLIPTQPGRYAFRVTGTVHGRGIDAASACSDRSFDCVTAATEVQFPAKEPANVDVVQGLSRALLRAQRATDAADSARGIAIGAIALSVLVLVVGVGVGAGVRGRRRSERD
jgi:hypothetical protein